MFARTQPVNSVNQSTRLLPSQQPLSQPRRHLLSTRPPTFASWATFSATLETPGSVLSTPRSTAATKRSSLFITINDSDLLISHSLSSIILNPITFQILVNKL